MSLPGVARLRQDAVLTFLLSTPHRVFFWTLASIVKVKWEFSFLFAASTRKLFKQKWLSLPAIVPHDVEFLLVLVSYFHFVDISWFLLGVKLGSSWGGWGWLRVEKSTFRKARLVVVLSNQFLFHSLPSVHFSCTNWNLAEKVKGEKKKVWCWSQFCHVPTFLYFHLLETMSSGAFRRFLFFFLFWG